MANRGLASRMTGKMFTVKTVAVNNTPADGQGFDVRKIERVAFQVEVLPGGTVGTINATFQHADTADLTGNYAAVADSLIEVPFGETVLPSSGVIALSSATTGFKRYGYKGNKAFVRIILSGAAATPDYAIATGATGEDRRHIAGS